jgi:Flp pilus assembly pilin Flp
VETAIIITAVALALAAFAVFIRNAVAGRFRAGADAFGYGLQYEGNRK